MTKNDLEKLSERGQKKGKFLAGKDRKTGGPGSRKNGKITLIAIHFLIKNE